MTRLPYETKGGHASLGETLGQLTEYLRLASEAALTIGHLYKLQHDDIEMGDQFLRIGQNLLRTSELATALSTKGHKVIQ